MGIARLAVHFQSVTEKFSPHDTIFSFTSASELVDSTLSAACSLHTAPASIKSSTSLRQKGLAGITEDAGENQSVASPNISAEQEVATILSVKDDNTRLDRASEDGLSPSIEKKSSPAPSSTTIRNTDKALPPTPDFPYDNEGLKRSIDYDDQVRPSLDGRQSLQSFRPSTRDGYSGYEFKPKVKLGPRPSVDSNSGQSISDPTSRAYDPRPVSSLPASVRIPTRKTVTTRPIASGRLRPPRSTRSLETNP